MPFDLRFTLHKLSVFCQVVEAGGVSRAAEQLYVAQPVVTAHIRSLEERLGARLFERAGRQMRLTPAGEAVYRWARETLTRARELERELGGLADGTTGAATIAASMSIGSYLLPPILNEFHRDRPAAAVSLTVSDPEHALEATATGEADFAVVVADELPEPGRFEAEILGREELVLVVAPEYPLPGPCCARETLRADAERAMERTLAAARDHVPATLPVTTQLLHGHPARKLAALVEPGAYDVVVLGLRRRRAVRRLLGARVVHSLLARSGASIMAVKEP